MDIEKICRSCLALNGPFLSIYDDGGSTGCIADMLSDFTKYKVRRADKLPEKVCLSCISEINRCYSFKLKCESSNRTLRQLVPDALPEECCVINVQPSLSDKSVQTVQVEKSTSNAEVQTEIEELAQKSDIIISSTLVSKSKRATYRRHKAEKEAQEEQYAEIEKKEQIENYELEDMNNSNEIIMELHSDSGENTEDHTYLQQDSIESATRGDNDNTYYEISGTNFEYTDENDTTEKVHVENITYKEIHDTQDDGDDGDSYVQLVYSEVVGNTTQESDFNFTIYGAEDSARESLTKPKQRKEFKCSECIMTFVSEKNLKRHIFKRHNDSPSLLSAQDPALAKVNDTKICKIVQLPLDNDINKKTMTNEDEVLSKAPSPRPRTPELVEMPSLQPIISKTEPAKLTHFCERCSAGFALRKSLNYHRKLNACTAKSYKCDECDRVFCSEETMQEHKATHALGNVCSECNKICKTKDELTRHMVGEHKRKLRNQCSACKRVFTMLSALRDHMRVHSGEKPFLCTTCGKGFTQNANLRQHMMRHSNEKNFKCDECGNSFVTKAELYSHKRIHSGDQPYKCEFCQSSFTTSSSLVKHKRKHTGERPYACDICPMRFSALSVLKNHRRTHTGEKPYKCVFCLKGFTQKGDCHIHQRTHTGERNYGCYCGEKFTHLSTLRAHMRTHDKNDKGSDFQSAVGVDTKSKKRQTRSKTATTQKDETLDIAIDLVGDDDQTEDMDETNDDKRRDHDDDEDEVMQIAMEGI